MELATAPTDPNVVYASADGGFGNPARLYRSDDAGLSWNPVQIDGPTDWLRKQGDYNQTLAVHPFDVDRLILGGIDLVEASLRPGNEERIYLTDFIEAGDVWQTLSLEFVNGTAFGGRLQTGDQVGEVLDVTRDDLISIEIRFGPGRSQKAHRYTVSAGASDDRFVWNSPDVPFAEYEYQDYTDVPFEVWDIDNNRQLMISFRDQEADGRFNPAVQYYDPDRVVTSKLSSRELVAIHGYSYDAASADERLAKDGGLTNKLLYYMIPRVNYGRSWDPENLPESHLRITASKVEMLQAETSRHPGNRWVHVDHHNLIFIPVDEDRGEFKLLNTNDGGVHFSEDGGETFSGATGYNTTQFYGIDKKPGENVYIGGTQDNGTWRSNADPQSSDHWDHVLGGDGVSVIWHSRDDRLVLATNQNGGIFRSTDGGMSYSRIEGPEDVGCFLTVLMNSRDMPDRVFSVGNAGVWRSEDFGEHWQIIPIPEEQWGVRTSNSGRLRVSVANANVVWAGSKMSERESFSGTMHVSLDGGQTFAPTTVPDFAPLALISGLATHPHQDSTAYILYSAYSMPKILHTTDLGQTWVDLSGFADSPNYESANGFPDAAVYDLLVMPHNPNILWAGTEIGLFESVDGGQSWKYADNGLPAVSIWQMKLVDDHVILATHGRGIWTLDMPQVVATEGYELPATFSLEQNYPNPFNPVTTIAFTLASDTPVTLTVFDALGRRVAVLLDRKKMTQGSHAVRFEAHGRASGVYFYQLKAGDAYSETKQMMLVK